MTEWIRDHDGRIVGAWNFQKMTETEARRRFRDHPVLNNAIERKTMNDDQALRKSLEGILAMSTPKPEDGEVYRDDRLDRLMSMIAFREGRPENRQASPMTNHTEAAREILARGANGTDVGKALKEYGKGDWDYDQIYGWLQEVLAQALSSLQSSVEARHEEEVELLREAMTNLAELGWGCKKGHQDCDADEAVSSVIEAFDDCRASQLAGRGKVVDL